MAGKCLGLPSGAPGPPPTRWLRCRNVARRHPRVSGQRQKAKCYLLALNGCGAGKEELTPEESPGTWCYDCYDMLHCRKVWIRYKPCKLAVEAELWIQRQAFQAQPQHSVKPACAAG